MLIEEVRLDGTHGTCRSRAERIKANGFRPGRRGRRGPGIYFWRGIYAKVLAIGWYNQLFDESEYSTDPDKNCAVIYATIISNKRTVLDLDLFSIKEKLAALAINANIDPDDWRENKLLLARYVDELEKDLCIEYEVILSAVSAPKRGYCKYPMGLLGMPSCIVVREVSCININNVEAVEDTNV